MTIFKLKRIPNFCKPPYRIGHSPIARKGRPDRSVGEWNGSGNKLLKLNYSLKSVNSEFQCFTRNPIHATSCDKGNTLTLSVTPHCLLLCEGNVPSLKSNVFIAAEFGVDGGEGEAGGAADTAESGDIDLPSPVEQREPPDTSSGESLGGWNGLSGPAGEYGGESSTGAKGISLLRKLIP